MLKLGRYPAKKIQSSHLKISVKNVSFVSVKLILVQFQAYTYKPHLFFSNLLFSCTDKSKSGKVKCLTKDVSKINMCNQMVTSEIKE